MMLDESTRSVPRLCGGIFLSLLEAAKKSTSVLRKQFGANGSGISMADMLTDLTRIADPSRSFPALENLKSSVSNYRMCAISKTGHFPFDDQSFVNTFADRMAQNYETVLAAMRSFVEKYFDLENTFACQRLVKSLVETIAADASIAETEAFTYMEGNLFSKRRFAINQNMIWRRFFWRFGFLLSRNDLITALEKIRFNDGIPKMEVEGRGNISVTQVQLSHERLLYT